MINDVFGGKVQYIQIIDELGVVDMQLMPKELTGQKFVEMLNPIMLTKRSNEKAVGLQRDGERE